VRSISWLVACGLLLSSAPAFPASKKKPKLVLAVPTTKGSHAVGKPSAGALYEAQKVPMKGKYISILPDHRDRNRNYASAALVKLLTTTSETFFKTYKRRVFVGDLSAKRGGKISGHASHQNGLDVDMALFYVDAKGKPIEPKELVALDDTGISKDKKFALDATATWLWINALLQNPDVQIQYIFLYEPLIALVLEAAKKEGASDELLEKVSTIVRQPTDSSKHDDHMHLRIYCPSDAEDLCEQTGPIWSFIPEKNEAADLTAK
jgi:penicillin-insensitive murein endopeptidase